MIRKLKNFFSSQKKHPKFTVDWFSSNIDHWENWLNVLKNKPRLRFLEIGCFEGRATRWFLENILTHRTSKIVCVDTFLGNWSAQDLKGVNTDLLMNFDMRSIKNNFYH